MSVSDIIIFMKELVFTIISGVIVAIIVSWLGIGGTSHVSVHGSPVRKTGKWIIVLGVLMIIGGLAWAGRNSTSGLPAINGYVLAGYGLIFFIAGKVVSWFQRP